MVRIFRTGCNARPVEKANMAFSIAGIRSSHRSTCCTSGSSRCMTGMGASSTLGCHNRRQQQDAPRARARREVTPKRSRKNAEARSDRSRPRQPTSQLFRQAGKSKAFFEPCTILWAPERYSITKVGDPVQRVGGTQTRHGRSGIVQPSCERAARGSGSKSRKEVRLIADGTTRASDCLLIPTGEQVGVGGRGLHVASKRIEWAQA